MYAFSAAVNSGKTAINGKLTANIDVNPGYTFSFIPDTGLVEIKNDGSTVAFFGMGIKGEALEGGNTQFDETAASANNVYMLDGDTYIEVVDANYELRTWISIGKDCKYIGTFDGNGKTVSGLYGHMKTMYTGMFGYISNGSTVRNIGVESSYLNSGTYIGGVVGFSDGGVVQIAIIRVISEVALKVAVGWLDAAMAVLCKLL